MGNIIHILHLEDRPEDSILIHYELKKGLTGFKYHFVETEKDFLQALEKEQVDIILSDFDLLDYSGADALKAVKNKYPHIPFIFVSGVMGEDAAINSMKDGAVDYVLKSKLQRLVPAINRALHEAELLREKIFADNERRKLSLAVEQSSVSIVITNRDAIIEYANPKACEVTGYSREELLGKNPRVLQSGEVSRSFYQELWDTIGSGHEWHGEFHNIRKNGELFWESVAISPVFNQDGEITNYIAIKEDITRKKELIAELEAAKEKAEASDRLKTAFLESISHEIRTPLNGILGFSSFLSENDLSEEKRLEFVRMLKVSGDRLLNTITEYLDISLIASGNVEVIRREVFINKEIQGFKPRFQRSCIAKKLAFSVVTPADTEEFTINTDPELFRKIISHLLDNALKFTEQGSIMLGYTIHPAMVEFFVKDTGSGIEPEDKDRIFEIFMQEDISITRVHEGSGLGLPIIKGFLNLLGGDIRVDSSRGEGSAFYFTLPLSSRR